MLFQIKKLYFMFYSLFILNRGTIIQIHTSNFDRCHCFFYLLFSTQSHSNSCHFKKIITITMAAVSSLWPHQPSNSRRHHRGVWFFRRPPNLRHLRSVVVLLLSFVRGSPSSAVRLPPPPGGCESALVISSRQGHTSQLAPPAQRCYWSSIAAGGK